MSTNQDELLKEIVVGFEGPGWCGSVDGAPDSEAKGHQLDSQSGHMPGLWARSPVCGMQEELHSAVSLPLFLPPFPSL